MSDKPGSSGLPLRLLFRGKVRDVYDAGSGSGLLLIVASDRVSAFDVVLPDAVPRKGEVLTQLTAWWISRLRPPVRNHLVSTDPAAIEERLPVLREHREAWAGRAMLVRRADPLPVECVVRGYLAGSAWREYAESGTLAGEALPPHLREGSPLHPPLFSPATKAREGHDENITFETVANRIGSDRARKLRDLSLAIFAFGAEVARDRGIILADTKFEFGTDRRGRIALIDEVMTPDSSRFWPIEPDRERRRRNSLDKQPIRDYLDELSDWDKTPPPPPLPAEIVRSATERYLDLFERLTGMHLNDFLTARVPESGEAAAPPAGQR